MDIENITPIEYRGMATDRGLTSALNLRDGYAGFGILELLGLSLEELKNKKILDVGIGGGRALQHGLELDLDYNGCDILPLINTNNITSTIKKQNVDEMARRFEEIRAKNPERVKACDFSSRNIPYHDNEFDIVLSCIGIPNYARSEREVIFSILNMIRLARERVFFEKGWHESENSKGIVKIGIGGENKFRFNMKKFLEELVPYGISYKLRSIGEKGELQGVELDTKDKDLAFNKLFNMFETRSHEFLSS